MQLRVYFVLAVTGLATNVISVDTESQEFKESQEVKESQESTIKPSAIYLLVNTIGHSEFGHCFWNERCYEIALMQTYSMFSNKMERLGMFKLYVDLLPANLSMYGEFQELWNNISANISVSAFRNFGLSQYQISQQSDLIRESLRKIETGSKPEIEAHFEVVFKMFEILFQDFEIFRHINEFTSFYYRHLKCIIENYALESAQTIFSNKSTDISNRLGAMVVENCVGSISAATDYRKYIQRSQILGDTDRYSWSDEPMKPLSRKLVGTQQMIFSDIITEFKNISFELKMKLPQFINEKTMEKAEPGIETAVMWYHRNRLPFQDCRERLIKLIMEDNVDSHLAKL